MGFVDRLRHLGRRVQRKRGERAIDRDEARAEGVSAREIRHRRKRWSHELRARRHSQVFHQHRDYPPRLAQVFASPPIVDLFEQIGTLSPEQLDALSRAGAEEAVLRFSLRKARLRFPGGEAMHAAFARRIFVAVSEREHAVGATCNPSDVSRVIEAAALALAATEGLSVDEVNRLMEPWLTVIAGDSV
jgi:hypothetical protein